MASKIAEAIAREQAEKAEADWKQSVSARLEALEKLIAELTAIPDTKPTTRTRKKSTD